MKVIYKKDIVDKVQDALTTAYEVKKEIERIELSRVEFDNLLDRLESRIISRKKLRRSSSHPQNLMNSHANCRQLAKGQ